MHPYETIPLSWAGFAIGIYCIVFHGWMLWKPAQSQAWLRKLPRNEQLGGYVLAVALIWFWLLVAPEGKGIFSALTMDLGEFNGAKPVLRLVTPVAFFLILTQVKEFLVVRSLGVLALLAAAPLLDAAFLKEPSTRLLVPLFAYALLTKGMFWIGMPYTMRDGINFAAKSDARWKGFAIAGLVYGVVTLMFALTSWRGH